MNQHSLIAEKMESYCRIVQLSKNFQSCQPIVQNNGFPRCQSQTHDSKIVETLIGLNPELIQILKVCLLSNLEVVKIACLKHIEYIFDSIGCSIGDKQIINTIESLIKTYPHQSGCCFVFKPHQYQILQSELIIIESFTWAHTSTITLSLNAVNLSSYDSLFSISNPIGQSDAYQSEGSEMIQGQVQKIRNQADQISVWQLYKDFIQVKQANIHHQNQLLSIKNHFNHILESVMQLFNSTSEFLLKQLFEKILMNTIFKGQYDTIICLQNEQLANELRIFLIKYADKIASVCQGDLKISAKFLSNVVKSIIPSLLLTKEQIELENKVMSQMSQGDEMLQMIGYQIQRKSFDQQIMLKSPSLILNDSVQMACEKLWHTIINKIISQYSLTSEQMGNICQWVTLNLKYLGQLSQAGTEKENWVGLTIGQSKFLNLNIELIKEIVSLQVNHIQLQVPQLTEQEKQLKRLNKKKNGKRMQMKTMKEQQNENFNHLSGHIHHQMLPSNIANYPGARLDEEQAHQQIPDNITDLDQQNKLVDSINDEFEYHTNQSFHSMAEDQDLFMNHQRLTNIYNRTKRLDNQDQMSAHQMSVLNDNQNRLIKLPSASVLQPGVFQFIDPLLFWMEYSIRTRDKLHLFKQIWQILKTISQQCCIPQNKLKIDLIATIFPHLQKVKDVCQSNTPSLDMLHFLNCVLQDIRLKDLKKNIVLREFLIDLFKVFCKNIPHYIHDEIFKTCEILLQLTKSYLNRDHYDALFESLIDKFTMKSKAYKQLLKQFLDSVVKQSQNQYDYLIQPHRIKKFVIQEIQNKKMENDVNEVVDQEPTVVHQMSQEIDVMRVQISSTNMQQPALSTQIRSRLIHPDSRAPQAPLDITSQDDIDNYVYEDQESGSHILDDDREENQITHLRLMNQAMRQRLDRRMDQNRSFFRPHQLTNSRSQQIIGFEETEMRQRFNSIHQHVQQQTQERREPLPDLQLSVTEVSTELFVKYLSKLECLVTPFDIVCQICIFENLPPVPMSENFDQKLENHLEKLDIVIQVVKTLGSQNSKLVERFLARLEQRNVLQALVSNDLSETKIITLMLDIANYCKENFQQMRVNKYVIQQPNFFIPRMDQNEGDPRNMATEANMDQMQEEAKMMQEQQKQVVIDSVQTLSFSKLTLVKLFTQLIAYLKNEQVETSNHHKKQQILNLMMVLWTYLLPIPSLTNQMVKSKINDTKLQVWLMECHHSSLHRDQQVQRVIEQCLIQLQQNNFIYFKKDQQEKQHINDQTELSQFETMIVLQENYFNKGFQSQHQSAGFMNENIECTSLKYLLSVISQGLQSFEFLESILLQTCGQTTQPIEEVPMNSFFGSAQRVQIKETNQSNPWVSQKFLATKILIKIIQLYNIETRSDIGMQLLSNSLQLISKLIKRDLLTEDRACALNLLAAVCGFTRQVSLLDDHNKSALMNPLAQELNSPRHMIQQIFAQNGQKISLQIWHEVFNILDAESKAYSCNEQTLREAASIIIQMAAPRDSVFHFIKLSYEKSLIVISQIQNQLTGLNLFSCNLHMNSQVEESSSYDSQDDSSDCSDSSNEILEQRKRAQSHAEFEESKNQSFPVSSRQQNNDIMSYSTKQRTVINVNPEDMTQSRGFKKYVSNYFYADNYSDPQLFAMINFFEDENQVKFSLSKNLPFGDINGNLVAKHTISKFQNTQVTYQNNLIHGGDTERIDSLMQNSNQSNNENNDLQLQTLWVDRTQNQSESRETQTMHTDKFNEINPSSFDVMQGHISPIYQSYPNDTPIFDGFEDQIIQGLNFRADKPNKIQNSQISIHPEDLHDHNNYLIYDRRYEKDVNNISENQIPNEQVIGSNMENRVHPNEHSPSDDLGIIDLDDEDDKDDLFDVDDDKLPILKNIFSKKNRPNNAKSVAIGSRSQGGTMKIRPQLDTIKAQKRQTMAIASRTQFKKSQKEKTITHQKPNSAQRILRSHQRGLRPQNTKPQLVNNISTSVLSRSNSYRDEPVVIYDEDNLIIDEFLTGGRQRPQSGRVNRQRPLSGKVEKIEQKHINSNKLASKEYKNKYLY